AAGVAALFITDQTFPNRCNYLPGKQVVPVTEMIAKLKAALDARRDPDLIICARTDVASIEGLDAAIARCQLFMEAGADMAKPQGVHTIVDMRRVVRERGAAARDHVVDDENAIGRPDRISVDRQTSAFRVAHIESLPDRFSRELSRTAREAQPAAEDVRHRRGK